ncbi:MAG: tRNA threonylcarbamoyladenosine dehydratase [Prevotella sp.]|nr:tRNA threonylcarbamoyladenosine dehydratase [Prevotella sp.]
MEHQFSRTEMLIGTDALNKLRHSKVIIFGVGGVGGYVCEALARSGVGEIHLVDNDIVSITNINRQILALLSTVGRDKVDVAEERIADINPQCVVRKYKMFYLPENADDIDLSQMDYVVDCIDTVKAKLELARRCHRLGVPFISSMGAANKMNPAAFRVLDIQKTQMDPLAKVIRKQLRREGILHMKVVCSEEKPIKPADVEGSIGETQDKAKDNTHKQVPASNAFVPAAAGLVIASEVVKDLIMQ